MTGIEKKLICLSLNAEWRPIGYKSVKKAIIDLVGSEQNPKPTAQAIDMDYELDENGEPIYEKPTVINPVSWDIWCNLPIRPWDLTISTPKKEIRVPTVIVAVNFSEMPKKTFNDQPSVNEIFERDKGVCQYSGKKIPRHLATKDHVKPKSRGGKNTWTNQVLCSKDMNAKKGNKTLEELGWKLLSQPKAPEPVPLCDLIKEIRHEDWRFFMNK